MLTLRGKISIPEKLGNPYEFDYKKYLNSKNIIGCITTYEVKICDVKTGNIFIKIISNLKDKISINLERVMPKRECNLFKSMLYGDDKFLDVDIKDSFEKSGLSHLLAVSGSNITTIMFVVSYIFQKLNKKISVLFSIVITFIFCVFCSFELSIVRASLFLIINNILKKQEKKFNTYIKIFLSFYLILVYNPFSIFNVGLLMSYVSVVSIIMFESQIFSLIDNILKKFLKIQYKKAYGIKKYIYNALCLFIYPFSITLSVQILLFPIQIYYFNSFYLSSFVSNIIISYIDNILGIVGFLTVIFSFIPYVFNILSNTSFIILRVIIHISNFFSNFSKINIKLASPDILTLVLYYTLILGTNYRKYLSLILKRKYRKVVNILLNMYFFLTLMYIPVSYIYLNYYLNYVIYFNVEQGNMAYIRYKGKNVVIDMGSTKEKLASNVLLNYLDKKNISKIDAILITHFHADHINGLNEKLLSNIDVSKVIYSRPKEEQKEYNECIKLLNKNNITKVEVTANDELAVGEIKFKILSPNVNLKIKDDDVANANSIVTVVNLENKNLLFMGDATKNTEKEILKNMSAFPKIIDVYQVGHHGSKTSSDNNFIGELNIKEGIISSKKKVYNHPAEETLNTLSKHNIKVKITEKNGACKIKI